MHCRLVVLEYNTEIIKMNFYEIMFNIPQLPDSSLSVHLLSTFCSASRSLEESITFGKPSTRKAASTTVRSLSSSCLNMASWMFIRL